MGKLRLDCYALVQGFAKNSAKEFKIYNVIRTMSRS